MGVLKVGRQDPGHWDKLRTLFERLEALKPSGIVRVYDWGLAGTLDNREVYFYLMEPLKKLDHQEENAVFAHMVTLDTGETFRFDPRLMARVEALFAGLDELGLEHLDPTPQNVMKDRKGNLKFVDLESFIEGL